MNKLKRAINVVKLVITVRDKVLFIDRSNKSINSSFLYFLKFSLTLSNITTVSFIEYPAIVRIAAMLESENSIPNNDNTPRVNNTSCVSATIAPKPNCHSNLIQNIY